jgi:tellurite resistance protein TerB
VVAGCAVVAYADGWVTEEERRRMLGLIRGFPPMVSVRLEQVEARFDEITRWFEADHDEGERRALGVVQVLRAREPADRELLVQTCCAIADADGGFDAEERRAVLRICETLEIEPARFDLADAR